MSAHAPYFAGLQDALRRHGVTQPTLVIDLDRLDNNLDVVLRSVRAGGARPKQLRLVEKSLPSPGLLGYLMHRAQTHRLMSFHAPFLAQDATHFPDCDLLLGKPMPVAAAARFYAELRGTFDPARQLQWLIDTPQRLAQYHELARGLDARLRINIEIDAGLHRGGFDTPSALLPALELIARNPRHLEFAGFMGYEPHVALLPRALGRREALLAKALAQYRTLIDAARAAQPALWNENLIFNTAGSPTYRLHEREDLCNEISVGSALLKPGHFDLPTLREHQPAAFIATPVLKTAGALQLPGANRLSRLLAWFNPELRAGCFIYGGNWMANYVSPAGLRPNRLYGHSSNQELATGAAAAQLAVDDLVFLRPKQSESVLLQFGDLLAVRGDCVEAQWPVFAG